MSLNSPKDIEREIIEAFEGLPNCFNIVED